jgi:glutamate carboxypeptidase
VVNVGRIVGGDSEFVSDMGEEHRFIGTTERLNIVADRCLVEGEVRFLDLGDRDRILAAMNEACVATANHWGVDMRLIEVEHIHPMAVSGAGTALADHLVSAAENAGWHLELERNRGGVSFPNFLPEQLNAGVIDGLGPVGGGMHTRDEYLDLQSLERRIALIAEALLYIRDNSSRQPLASEFLGGRGS